MGKFARIIVEEPRLLARDGYDFCTAYEKDPQVFYRAVNEVIDEAHDPLLGLIGLIQKTPHRIILGRQLLDPIDAKLTHDPWGRFAEIVNDYTSGWRQRPAGPQPGIETLSRRLWISDSNLSIRRPDAAICSDCRHTRRSRCTSSRL